MYSSALSDLLPKALNVVNQRCEIPPLGPDTPLITLDREGYQRFWAIGPDGVKLQMGNIPPYRVTWGDLQSVLEGLPQDCRLHLCNFKFTVASGQEVGGGLTYKE